MSQGHSFRHRVTAFNLPQFGGGGSSGGGNTTTVQKADPWSGQQPYLTGNSINTWAPGLNGTYSSPNGGPGIFGAAQSLYTNTSAWPGFYPGMDGVTPSNSPTYVPMTGTQQAIQGEIASNGVNGGTGSIQNANNFLSNTLGSGYTGQTQGAFGQGQDVLGSLMDGSYRNLYSNSANFGQNLLTDQLSGSYTNGATGAMNTGLGALSNIAGGTYSNPNTSPAYNQSQGVLQNELSADYLDPMKTPGMQSVINNTLAQVMPGITSSFTSGNRSGGGLAARAASQGATDAVGGLLQNQYNTNQQIQQNAVGQAASNQNNAIQAALNAAGQGTNAYLGQGQLQQGAAAQAMQGLLGGQANSLSAAQQAANNFLTQQGNQIKGAALAPGVDQTMMGNYQTALNAAGLTQQDLQNQVNSDMSRYNYNAMLPYNMLNQYANAVQGSYGGTSSTSTPYYQNQGANLLSGGLGGAALGSALAGTLGMSGGLGAGLGAGAGALLAFM